MGMGTSITGYREPDERHKKMCKIYNLCSDTGVMIPGEVDDYFDGGIPDKTGIAISLEKYVKEVSQYDHEEGFQIKLSDLPEKITHIRFVNSY